MHSSKKLAFLLLLSYSIHKINSLDPLEPKKYAVITFLKSRLLTLLLFKSAYNGNTDGIIEAIKRNANLDVQDENGKTPLMVAVIHKHFQTAKALLLAGASPEIKNRMRKSALTYTTRASTDDIRLLLLQYVKN